MNENDDSFEAQLRSLRPAPPSPHVKQHIAQQLSARPPMKLHRRGVGVIGGIAAAIAIAVLWFALRPESPAPPLPQIARSARIEPNEHHIDSSAAQVTVWHYRQAAQQSPDRLMRLLDEQAADARAIGGPTPTVRQLLEANS